MARCNNKKITQGFGAIEAKITKSPGEIKTKSKVDSDEKGKYITLEKIIYESLYQFQNLNNPVKNIEAIADKIKKKHGAELRDFKSKLQSHNSQCVKKIKLDLIKKGCENYKEHNNGKDYFFSRDKVNNYLNVRSNMDDVDNHLEVLVQRGYISQSLLPSLKNEEKKLQKTAEILFASNALDFLFKEGAIILKAESSDFISEVNKFIDCIKTAERGEKILQFLLASELIDDLLNKDFNKSDTGAGAEVKNLNICASEVRDEGEIHKESVKGDDEEGGFLSLNGGENRCSLLSANKILMNFLTYTVEQIAAISWMMAVMMRSRGVKIYLQ